MSSSDSLSENQPNHHHTQLQPNGFIAKSDHFPNGGSHEHHVTGFEGERGSSHDSDALSNDLEVFDEPLTDPFYNFDESNLDPSSPHFVPFYDDTLTTTVMASGQEFDPELFNSILSSGDDMLTRLDKESSSGNVASFDLNVGGEEEDEERTDSSTPTNASQTPGG